MKSLNAPALSSFSPCEVLNVKTITFNAKFSGMRKEQEFTVYAPRPNASSIVIQSDTRIGEIYLESGICRISKNQPSGAYFGHLAMAEETDQLKADELEALKKSLNNLQ